MELKKVIQERRALRSLDAVKITRDLVKDLATFAGLAPSCFNNQPWRYVFVWEKKILKKVFAALSGGNSWAKAASLIIAVFSQKDLDCVIREREYHLFDTGMATGFLILRAAYLGLVAHPIAGFNEEAVKSILQIPENMRLITLVIVGKKTEQISPLLSEKQVEIEKKRPSRLEFSGFSFINSYKKR